MAGDPDADVALGTLFGKLPEDCVCPECAEAKGDQAGLRLVCSQQSCGEWNPESLKNRSCRFAM